MAPCDWDNGGSADVFFPCQCGSTRGELMLFQVMGMESKDKIALYCSREKCR